MSQVRSEAETAALAAEAERRVRAGEKHADVADALGVPPSTLADWARRGGWRRKDLGFERNAERGRLALQEIALMVAREREGILKQTAEAKEIAAATDAAMNKADPEGEGQPTALLAVSARGLSMAMAQRLLQQGHLVEAERAARLALRFQQAEKATNEPLRTQWLQDRANVMSWWQENSSSFLELQKRVADLTQQLEERQAENA
jgi:hypothetical protein